MNNQRCLICSTLLIKQNHHYKSMLCFNCEAYEKKKIKKTKKLNKKVK